MRERKSKYNYEATLDPPPFVGVSQTVEVIAKRKKGKDRKGNFKWQQTVRKNVEQTLIG
jgi:hypothetical protein